MISKHAFSLILSVICFCACISKPNAQLRQRAPSFSKTLIIKQVPGTPYHISLPLNYIIKESRGPDFSVYHFTPSDITDHTSFTGGFYIGNAPSLFDYSADGYKKHTIKSYLLQENQNWTIYSCNNKYHVQLITKSKSGFEWATMLHVFGTCTSKSDLDKLLDVYATITVKKQ